MLEMTLLAAMPLQRCRLRLPEGTVVCAPKQLVTLRPEEPVTLLLARRGWTHLAWQFAPQTDAEVLLRRGALPISQKPIDGNVGPPLRPAEGVHTSCLMAMNAVKS
ncbi:hypothetical protein [Acidovorax sp.]|uniref:hypothetical protein n=1 Tax=Acidovorax sp. TaxID=1872122 RepID=UPI003919D27F